MWLRKKKSSKALLDFIVPIKSITTTEGGKGVGAGVEREKNPKESTEQAKT